MHGAPIAMSGDIPLTFAPSLCKANPLPGRFSVQGVYYRRSSHVPWVLVKRTRSVADAEISVRRVATDQKVGRLLYLETTSLPETIWDMRGLDHRTLGTWLVKALRKDFRKVKQSGRQVWQPHDPRQLKLF
jgi:hypothetical protein